MPLIRSPITLGDDVWIGADAFVGPGVRVERLAVVGARSSVYKDVEANWVVGGNPARKIKPRIPAEPPTPGSETGEPQPQTEA